MSFFSSLRRNFLSLVFMAISLSFIFIAAAGIAKDDDKKHGDNDHDKKCDVCHNTNNPHTISISCDEVAKYLHDHPGDYAGPCHTVSGEKPPTPTPTPTPHHSPTPTPTPTPHHSPTPTPTPTPHHSPTPTPTPTPHH